MFQASHCAGPTKKPPREPTNRLQHDGQDYDARMYCVLLVSCVKFVVCLFFRARHDEMFTVVRAMKHSRWCERCLEQGTCSRPCCGMLNGIIAISATAHRMTHASAASNLPAVLKWNIQAGCTLQSARKDVPAIVRILANCCGGLTSVLATIQLGMIVKL